MASADGKHGTSKTYPGNYSGDVKYSANFMSFAPMPCVCWQCCVSDLQRQRMHAHVYENKFVVNFAVSPFVCLACDDRCIMDLIVTMPYDKPPFRTGLCGAPCCCIPATCCGPPVMYSFSPKLACIDLTSCYGQRLMAAPCNLFGCKQYIVCGNPCYTSWGVPVLQGGKDLDQLTAHLSQQMKAFAEKNGFPASQTCIFENVSDNIGDFGGAKKAAAPAQEEMM